MSKTISAKALHDLIQANATEYAIVDVRGERAFSDGHLMHAISVPLGRLEVMIGDLAPRLATPLILTDADGSMAARAAGVLEGVGYTDVSVLKGGTEDWREAGYEVYGGFNVPSKAFGEFVEHHFDTPSVSAEELKAMMDGGEKMVVLDSRPMDEYNTMNIPTGVCCPGGELVYRVGEIAPDPGTTVVVNCAGRTRSIIGAQSLINAGIKNKVVALRNGTMGWHLSGFQLEHGNTHAAPQELSGEAIAAAKARVADVAKRFGVGQVDLDTAKAWLADDSRTTYLLDVRHPHEYEAGHMPGSISSPGGQLVQATDRYAGVRGARLVLIDDTNLVRATMAAHWLTQMHWDVHVLAGGLPANGLENGKQLVKTLGIPTSLAGLSADAAKAKLDAGWIAIDFSTSRDYRKGHVPGAWWATRARLETAAANLPDAPGYLATSEDGLVAKYAAAELAKLTGKSTGSLDGGTKAWVDAGMPLEKGETHLADEADDVWLKPYERKGVVEDFMKEYLTWEIDLIKQVERDDLVSFRAF